jgi:hypothetical protein
MNSVIEDRSFCASSSPKTCSALRPCRPVRIAAHASSRGPSAGWARYALASPTELIA